MRHGSCIAGIMILSDLLSPESVVASLKVVGKKQALQEIAAATARVSGLGERELFETLLQRERLGSTGIGEGIAIPHGRSAHASRLHGLFARLEKPIDFEALDGQPVDIIFALIAPEGAGADHLKALARVARILRDPGVLERIRAATDPAAIFSVLTAGEAKAA
jgi:PTS system nitrogen regulatory IIA component